jgi:hypothetical protein
MSDDIVTRLRHWANGAAEQGVHEVVDGLNFAADQMEWLREQLRLANIHNFNMTAEIERLTAERDEARRAIANVARFRSVLDRSKP